MEVEKSLEAAHPGASAPVAAAFWTRALWMRLGALNGLVSLCILLLSGSSLFAADVAAAIRLGAQIQFMHGMATLACATFMNIGATGARLAPAFFLGGVGLFCLPTYLSPVTPSATLVLVKGAGLCAFAAGWTILAWSARDIDKS